MSSYTENYRRIKAYAKLCDIQIIWKDKVEGIAEFDNQNGVKIISMQRSLAGRNIAISTLLHELGHALHESIAPNEYNHIRYEHALNRMDKSNPLTPFQKKIVLKNEKKAWDYGMAIARLLNLKIGKWYERDQTTSLKTYQDY